VEEKWKNFFFKSQPQIKGRILYAHSLDWIVVVLLLIRVVLFWKVTGTCLVYLLPQYKRVSSSLLKLLWYWLSKFAFHFSKYLVLVSSLIRYYGDKLATVATEWMEFATQCHNRCLTSLHEDHHPPEIEFSFERHLVLLLLLTMDWF
jgi:hypothetical protein